MSSAVLVDPHTEPSDHTVWVDATPFRAHLLFVARGTGVSWPVLAALGGVSHRGARSLVVGRRGRPGRRLHPGIAARVLDLSEDRVRAAGRARLGAERARERLIALVAAGWTVRELADQLRMPLAAPALTDLLEPGPTPTCSELTAATVSALVVVCGSDGPGRSTPVTRLTSGPVSPSSSKPTAKPTPAAVPLWRAA